MQFENYWDQCHPEVNLLTARDFDCLIGPYYYCIEFTGWFTTPDSEAPDVLD